MPGSAPLPFPASMLVSLRQQIQVGPFLGGRAPKAPPQATGMVGVGAVAMAVAAVQAAPSIPSGPQAL